MVAYNRDIPDAPNNPSVDQPKMKTNTNAVDTILAVDHISFNATNGGTHLQTSFTDFSSGIVIGGVPASVAYPAAGVADTSHAQYYFKNSTNTFLLSGIRAFALVTGSTGAIVAGQSLNASIVRNSIGNYTVTLTAGATNSVNYSVYVQVLSSAGFPNVQINKTSTTTFDIKTQNYNLTALNQTDFSQFCFFVYQI